MFIISRLRNYDGEDIYNKNSIVGIYDDYSKARNDLINKLDKMKYEYETDCDDGIYFYARITGKNGKEDTIPICFEIKQKKLEINQVKFSS